ncbi:hypothetical protein Cpap_3230 [Ruminiclostridium papyrosolvens DSM 2782]|uniref:Uncharacterized protein n=1 Tax=Ruminiclostridium papyrosolvens DSM 2782 TaxID=588581 RepID=F1TA64_9FIRM|nr:hypothetical protein [Ruminiclostridium papyrosolvens]EGD48806.1 hypothetical protein Cpap_3230 [Ruminiclostridium papyrosolvens DSM 2782]WES32440.1 hypothetical protein P0092_11750 [Ruminiclostridium papyrosolvens DSM 2782]
MKKLKLSVLLVVVAVAIAAVGSAALSSVSFDRSVKAGKILVDTDDNVAIQITNISKYQGLVKADSKGKVSININEAINSNSNTNSGFNTDAIFTIGSTSSGVIKIKNNSDAPVSVSIINESGNNNAIALTPVNNGNNTINVGGSGDFYFTINTTGLEPSKTLNGVLHVEAK